jgi:hypothetical protein
MSVKAEAEIGQLVGEGGDTDWVGMLLDDGEAKTKPVNPTKVSSRSPPPFRSRLPRNPAREAADRLPGPSTRQISKVLCFVSVAADI